MHDRLPARLIISCSPVGETHGLLIDLRWMAVVNTSESERHLLLKDSSAMNPVYGYFDTHFPRPPRNSGLGFLGRISRGYLNQIDLEIIERRRHPE